MLGWSGTSEKVKPNKQLSAVALRHAVPMLYRPADALDLAGRIRLANSFRWFCRLPCGLGRAWLRQGECIVRAKFWLPTTSRAEIRRQRYPLPL